MAACCITCCATSPRADVGWVPTHLAPRPYSETAPVGTVGAVSRFGEGSDSSNPMHEVIRAAATAVETSIDNVSPRAFDNFTEYEPF